ncbi:c-type cytochrome [Flavobacterium sp.]|uniref:c-type cytochrome n=1 Tax=Flavobacterium sp. TaxID=239 RepID=UPI003D6AEAAF
MKTLLLLMLMVTRGSYSNITEGPGDGKAIFENECSKCHGKDGARGRFGAKNLQKSRLTDAEYLKIISNGKSIMPAWKRRLSGEQINQVINYVKELKK